MIDEAVSQLLGLIKDDENTRNHTMAYNTFSNGGALSLRYALRNFANQKVLITGLMYNMTPSKPLSILPFMNELKND